jgi:hypothetical protein
MQRPYGKNFFSIGRLLRSFWMRSEAFVPAAPTPLPRGTWSTEQTSLAAKIGTRRLMVTGGLALTLLFVALVPGVTMMSGKAQRQTSTTAAEHRVLPEPTIWSAWRGVREREPVLADRPSRVEGYAAHRSAVPVPVPVAPCGDRASAATRGPIHLDCMGHRGGGKAVRGAIAVSPETARGRREGGRTVESVMKVAVRAAADARVPVLPELHIIDPKFPDHLLPHYEAWMVDLVVGTALSVPLATARLMAGTAVEGGETSGSGGDQSISLASAVLATPVTSDGGAQPAAGPGKDRDAIAAAPISVPAGQSASAMDARPVPPSPSEGGEERQGQGLAKLEILSGLAGPAPKGGAAGDQPARAAHDRAVVPGEGQELLPLLPRRKPEAKAASWRRKQQALAAAEERRATAARQAAARQAEAAKAAAPKPPAPEPVRPFFRLERFAP